MPPAPRKEHCGPAWPASSWPPTKPATSRWSSAGPRTTSVPAAAPSRCWATGSSPAALAGKTATVLGDPDQPHTYTYLPDIGEGLATLGEHPEAPGEVWHLPNDPRTRTTRQLVKVIYRLAGQPKTKLRSTPALLLRALGVTNPTIRELLELQYEFQEPFIVDSTKIATKLEVHATPLDQALAGTLATYRTSPAS
jgi:nucleoside-diphosphate-sugar epimerase